MKDNQGKTPQQTKDSTLFTYIGYFGLVLVITISLLFIGDYTGFNKKVEQGLQNDPRPLSPIMNYTHPSMWEDFNDTTGSPCIDDADGDGIPDIIMDSIDYDMDCGDNQYIPEYENFWNIPAGTDSIIMVCGILYERNEDETQWVPIYPDEDVMWVGVNGDTKWE